MISIYVDCTELVYSNSKTGIQRIERNILDALQSLASEFNVQIFPVAFLGKPAGLRKLDYRTYNIKLSYFEGIYLGFIYPNRLMKLTKAIFPFVSEWIEKKWIKIRFFLLPVLLCILPFLYIFSLLFVFTKRNKVNFKNNDIYFIPGSSWWAHDLGYVFERAESSGVKRVIILHDLIAINYPQFFELRDVDNFEDKLNALISNIELIVCVSKFSEQELKIYIEKNAPKRCPKTTVNYSGFKLDLIKKDSSCRREILFAIDSAYIAIGTIEPRKNYTYLIDAFDQLWDKKLDIKLCIIGKYGWKSEDLVHRILSHPQNGKNLFWFNDLNDRELMSAYRQAKACIYPSRVEGFGLPLIEALSLRCPVLASEIPVFHEIGGEYCHYFSLDAPESLVQLVEKVENLGLFDNLDYLDSFTWPDWKQSTSGLLTKILKI